MSQPSSQPVSRVVQLALFFAGCLWLLLSEVLSTRIAQIITDRVNLAVVGPLLEQFFLVILLLSGFTAIYKAVTRSGTLRFANALPKRPSSLQEWTRGAALGWGMMLIILVPMMLSGSLHPQFWLEPRSWVLALISLATLFFLSLAFELSFRGFLFARLIAAIGPVPATILMSLIYAVMSISRPNSTLLSVLVCFLFAILLSNAYMRTHAVWLGWGLHFAWVAVTGVLFGLPVSGYATYSSLISTTASGPDWLSGGAFGPMGALITGVVAFAAVFVLYRISRSYAWEFTQPEILPAGYAVVIAPPAAHTAMEETAAARPAPLVQILGATPTAPSTMPIIEEHLRSAHNANDPA